MDFSPHEAVPDPPPVSTTELDWPEWARRDGWDRVDGIWQHPDRDDAYDDADWVYLGDGAWEDAFLSSLPPAERRTALERYDQIRRDVAAVAPRRDDVNQPPRQAPKR